MLQSSSIVLDEYRVSSSHGFLPTELPLRRLPHVYYEQWENLAGQLSTLIQQDKIRDLIDALPVLTTTWLQTEPEWRRAYSILGFLTHAYIWGGQKPRDVLPPSISKPFLEISAHLGLPPCATYAGLTLWNFDAAPGADITDPDSLSTITSFTGTQDEAWFMLISVAIEAKGGKLITLMLDAIEAATQHNISQLTALLCRFTDVLQDVTATLKRMYEKERSAGSKNMAVAGLPNGVFYDIGNGNGEWRQYSGGSNAQSSLIQTFDIFLGVTHPATGDKEKETDQKALKSKGPGYIEQMRDYMPAPHKRFLEVLTDISNIRDYVVSLGSDSPAKEAFNAAVQSLTKFREAHIQIVTRYVITQSRISAASQPAERLNLATASVKSTENSDGSSGSDEDDSGVLHGTGGTSLASFLKQTRDSTKSAAC
ncbi:Indoleamine 2-3-dioxygenase [Penicillium chermesinum]|nr:Indoleamine 2-3-dioxygenase [Penicillium chermesinum]